VVAILPLGIIGVVAALLAFNRPLGFVAILGILSLLGMIAKNAVILIVQIEAGHADPTGGTSAPWVVKLPPTQLPPGLAPGQHIRLGFRPDDAWAFVPEGAAAPGS
jgi:hypothetical protein